jgi:hypothetical protein
MLECSKHNALVYHFEATHLRLPNGTYRDSGVPIGWPDLTIIKQDGSIHFAELKVGKNKPSKEQQKFLSLLPNSHLIYSLEEFSKQIF